MGWQEKEGWPNAFEGSPEADPPPATCCSVSQVLLTGGYQGAGQA